MELNGPEIPILGFMVLLAQDRGAQPHKKSPAETGLGLGCEGIGGIR
jgi:hypothetical protein